jgi:hypothetical protein
VGDNIEISAKKSVGYYELTHISGFDEGCSKLLDQRNKRNCNGYSNINCVAANSKNEKVTCIEE